MFDTGEHDLPAVLCLHSLFFDPRMFEELAERGRGRFRFIAPELIGQVDRVGEATGPVSMEAVAADLWRIVDGLGIDRFSIVAQSMGGDVAARMAASRPRRIDALVLLGTSVCAEPEDQLEQLTVLVDELEQNGFTEDKVDVLMTIMFGATTRADTAKSDVLALWRKRLGDLSPKLGPAMRGVVARTSAVHMLADIAAPTLVVSGTEDPVRPPAWSDEMFMGIPDAQLWRLKGMGHSPLQERPEIVNLPVLDFLSSKRVGLGVSAGSSDISADSRS
jgi:3-oxoadipate enol-lactonase